ncbi:Hypothetical protein D9617_22g066930 [Elsinoe fawcettii]|nr:Hypothetical protein D9617_22g066930 [Elsinoe fawcettii]
MSPVSAGVGFNGPPQPEPELSTESATAMTTNLGWYFFGRIGSGSTGPQQTGPIASKVMASCQDAVTTMANGLGAEIKPSFYVPTKQELTTINNAQKNTNGVSFTTPIQNEVSDNKRKATEDPTAAQPPPAKQVKETPAPVTTNSAAAAKPAPGMPQLASPATTTGSPPPVVSPPKGSTPGSSGTPQLPSPATSAASTDYFGNWEQYVKTPSSPSTPSWASPSPAPAAIKPAAAAGSAAKSTGPVPGAKDYFQDWSNPSINPHRPVRPQ